MPDNLRVHHAELFKAWLAEHDDEIEMFYSPSYSPELNPEEYLNCDLKSVPYLRNAGTNRIFRPPVLQQVGTFPFIIFVFKRKEADEAVQHESYEKQMLTKMNDHRIFGPENDGSNRLLMRNQLNLLQVKLSPREEFTVNPRKIPTFRSW